MSEIRYPSEKWLADWQAKHNGTQEQAEMAWWDNEIDHDHPTPFDLDEEHEKAAKQIVRKPANYSLTNKAKRERKPNSEKRALLVVITEALKQMEETTNVEISNPEKMVDFSIGDNKYSFSLICHRKPK